MVNSLTFGAEKQQTSIKKMFSDVDHGSHTMFNMFKKDGKVNEELKNMAEDTPQLYYYFVKLVPHQFIDLIKMREWRSYSYSLAHNKKSTDNSQMIGLTFIFDYAPVKMILTKQNREFGQFAINLCSIVGGAFIICGLVNSLCLSITNKCKRD